MKGQGYYEDAMNYYNQAQNAYNSPLGQAAVGQAKKYFGFGGARLQPATAGQMEYAMRHAGSGRRRRGGFGAEAAEAGLGLAGQAIGMIPGAAEALGPFGALLGIEAPPPPPPRASFSGIRGYVPPPVHARQGVVGRGKKMVEHLCPHCGEMHPARSSTMNHKCKMCGGKFSFSKAFKSVANVAKKVASNPMVQRMASAAVQHYAPQAMAAAQRYAPGLTSAVQRYAPQAMAAAQNPAVAAALAAARARLGHGRRTRAPTAHSLAVKRVMAEHGMTLGGASKYVKQHGLAQY